MSLPRSSVRIMYAGVDISRDVAPDLISFSYKDNEGGKADDVDLKLRNDHGRWSEAWLPERGDKLDATIIHEAGGDTFELPCGTFTVDELEASGPPSVVSIRGSSMPTDSPITRTRRSRAWENVRLHAIVDDVAKAGGLSVLYGIDPDPLYDRRDQREETDLAFLLRICSDEGFILKCTNERIVVFDPRKLADSDPVATLRLGTDLVTGWRLGVQNHDTYAACSVEYKDPRSGRVQRYEHREAEDGKVKKLNRRAASAAEAARMAAAGLYDANSRAVAGSITVAGDTRLVAGATVRLEGFGRFSGKYLIREATHAVGTGYTTTIEISTTREALDELA